MVNHIRESKVVEKDGENKIRANKTDLDKRVPKEELRGRFSQTREILHKDIRNEVSNSHSQME